jgi:hypothetical protein
MRSRHCSPPAGSTAEALRDAFEERGRALDRA